MWFMPHDSNKKITFFQKSMQVMAHLVSAYILAQTLVKNEFDGSITADRNVSQNHYAQFKAT